MGLLLKSELIDEQGEIIEQLVYTNIDLPASIPDDLLEPAISGAGYTWYNDDQSAPVTASAADSEPGWTRAGLRGLRAERGGAGSDPASRDPVEHIVFSDGLASVSVFIEQLDAASEPLSGLDTMGAVNAYGRMVEDYQITVVGEVPPSPWSGFPDPS